MNNSLVNLIVVQFKEFFREPAILFWALVFPLAIAGVLGIAFTKQAEPTRRVAIIKNENLDNSITLARLRRSSENREGEQQQFVFFMSSLDSAVLKLKRGEISLFIEVAGNDSLIFNFDPQNGEGKMTYLLLENKYSKGEASDLLKIRPIIAKGNRYIDFLIPGLIALGVMNSCIWGIGWNLIEARIKKLMRRMVATPMKKSYFLLGHIISRALLSSVEGALLFLFAYFVFGVTMQGSVFALLIVFFTGVMAFAGVAVIASSRATTTTEGNGIINAIVLPITILSGVFFSYRGFPDWAVSIIEMLPLTMLANGLRAIFNEGATFRDVGGEVFGLAITGIMFFAIGLKIYKWY